MKFENVKAWATVGESGLVGIFETREEARNNKRYAAMNGHKQVVVKLKFDKIVR